MWHSLAKMSFVFMLAAVLNAMGFGAAFAQGDAASNGAVAVDGALVAGVPDDSPNDSGESQRVDLSRAKIELPSSTYRYTSAAIEPMLEVMLDGKPLVSGIDYDAAYRNCTEVGQATVTVTGRGAYKGSVEAHYAITPGRAAISSAKSTSARKITVKVAEVPGAQGYQYKVQGLITELSKNQTLAFKGLKEGKKYTVKVRAYADIDGVRQWGEWSKSKAVKVLYQAKWQQSGGYFKYRLSSGKYAHGLTTIKGKSYLFDGAGRQKVGWQKHKGRYLRFNVANKKGGYLMTSQVVNGIKLAKDGTAHYSSAGLEELKIMVKAQKLAEQITVPSQSKHEKLVIGFDWMLNNCKEQMIHQFGSYAGWHRTFANEIYDLHNGSCFSYGAAYAYYANAIGYQSCRIVSSGGHGWAEIDGDVYDIEWTRHNPNRYFAWPYSRSGFNGAPGYASARIYVVQITPNTSTW